MSVKPITGPTRVKRTTSNTSESRRVGATLDAWLARDWSQGVYLGALEEFQQVHVCTQNSLYELVVVNRCGEVQVRGGRYFPDWTPARLAGCTAGGSFLKRLGINLGLQMEFEIGRRRILTSPVRSIALLEKPLTA
jgi:hypothetical protein